MNGRMLLAGRDLESLDLSAVADLAYVLVTEGLDAEARRDVDDRMMRAGAELDHPRWRERKLREEWGTSPAAVAGQENLMRFLEGQS